MEKKKIMEVLKISRFFPLIMVTLNYLTMVSRIQLVAFIYSFTIVLVKKKKEKKKDLTF